MVFAVVGGVAGGFGLASLGYEAATGDKIHERWKVLSQSVLLNSF